MDRYPCLVFTLGVSQIASFFKLLQQGVTIRVRLGCSVAAFFREELQASEKSIEKIQSIILDGKPVDDIETAHLRDGSILALSAAMPGLVGATLRRGGAYSSFRSAITYHEETDTCGSGEGLVTIKLFNLLMAEFGPGLLQRGVLLRSADFLDFVAAQSPDFREGCRQVTLDGENIDLGKLQDSAWLLHNDKIILSVAQG